MFCGDAWIVLKGVFGTLEGLGVFGVCWEEFIIGVGSVWKVVMEAFLWCRGVLLCVLGALGGVRIARGCFGGCLQDGVWG